MKKQIKFMGVLLTIIMLVGMLSGCGSKKDTVVVGSKNYNEQLILGNLIAIMLEKNTDLNVEKKFSLGGGSAIPFKALKNNEIDMYPDYTGTVYVNIMKRKPKAGDEPEEIYNIVKDHFDKEYKMTWLKPFGFNNTYALTVRKDTAEKYNLETVSDLGKVSDKLILGCTLEFNERQDGYPGMKKLYGLNFKDVKVVDGGLRYTALDNKKVDVVDAFSTEGLLKAFDLKVLDDDKKFFPPYYAAPIVNNSVLKKHPEIKTVLNKLGDQITEDEMQKMNYKVDKLKEKPEKVAEDFLKSKGLIE